MQINDFDMYYQYKANREAKGNPIPLDEKDNKAVRKLKKSISGKSLNQIDKEFYDNILKLLRTAHKYSIPERNETVQNLVETYREQTSLTMPNQMLTALADFILDDELTNKDIDKIRNNEYPIMSFRQLKRREIREISLEVDRIEYFQNKKNYNIAEKKRRNEKSENK